MPERASIADLKADYLFRARNENDAEDYATQKTWLYSLYTDAVTAGDAEGISTSFEGSTTQFQFRGATPEEHRLALKAAIEELEGLIAGNTAAAHSRPFAFRFTGTPFDTIG